MMPGGNDKQVTQTNSAPWKKAQDELEYGIGLGEDYLKGGEGFNPYPGSAVVDHSGQTTAALGGLESLATGAMGGGYQDSLQSLLDNNGFSQQQSKAMEAYKGAIDGNYNVDSSGFGDLSSSEINLQNLASGGMFGKNPEISGMLDQIQRRVADQMDLSASAAGRYGSGQHHENLARGIGDATGSLLFNQYNQDIGNQMQASGMIDNAKNARLGAMAGIDTGNMQRMLGGADSLFAAGSGIPANLAAAFQTSMAPGQALQTIGGVHENLSGRQLQDDIRLWEGNENADWNRLTNAMAIFGGAGGLGGSGTTTVAQPQASPWAQVGGNALAGFGATGSPWGAALGAASAIPSFF